MERPADTGLHRLLHQAMVAGFERLRDGVASTTPADRALRLPALVTWSSGLVAEIGAHHVDEDDRVFPALAERVPSADGLVAVLEADHLLLATLLHELTRAIAALADPAQPFVPAKASADLVLEHAGDLVTTHVGVEDADLLALIERHMTFDEHPASSGWPGEGAPQARLDWTVPWLLGRCPPQLRADLLDGAPAHVRVAWERAAPAHLALERVAFDRQPPSPQSGLAAG